MRLAPTANDPASLSYFAMRKAVGVLAIGLPFAVAIPWWFLRGHTFEASISCYYYTWTRNVFVGTLCAVATLMLCCQGYDIWDEIAGFFSAICALGVAFFPTAPGPCYVERKFNVGKIHWTFAALLFLTLACFCLFLFTMSAQDRILTPRKIQRNRVYYVCGSLILFSMLMIAVLAHFDVKYLPGGVGSDFFFETTALWAFGIAWLVKGEFILKDQNSQPSKAATTDGQAAPINLPHN
jgi:hypothetical protein